MGNTLNAQEQNISDADAKQLATERSSNMSYVAAYLCCARNGFVKQVQLFERRYSEHGRILSQDIYFGLSIIMDDI